MPSTHENTSWFDAFWPVATAATGVGYLATAYTVSRWLTRRVPAVLTRPAEFESSIHLLECRTADGIMLKGWALEPSRPRATVALFHGLRCNRTHMLDRARILLAAGYRCVAFDHRAHGESDGAWTSFGYHEQKDVAAIAELIASRWPHQACAALGYSMGAAALCFAAERSPVFRAVIFESLYHDLTTAFENRVGCGYPTWFGYFRRGILWFTEHRLALKVADVAPAAQIPKWSPRPILVITGSDDPHAPPEDAERMIQHAKETAALTIIPGAGHDDVVEKGGEAYRDRILSFLDKHVARNPLACAA